nr:lysM domain receptor-like kinase 3 [Ipomoea batatas]
MHNATRKSRDDVVVLKHIVCSREGFKNTSSFTRYLLVGVSVDAQTTHVKRLANKLDVFASLLRLTSTQEVHALAGIDVNGTIGYFYKTPYKLHTNDDSFATVNIDTYSSQAWKAGGEETSYKAGENVTMLLLCGCVGNSETSPLVTTYTVQPEDTLQSIAGLLSSQVGDILRLNPYLNLTQGLVDVGWVIYVPMNQNQGFCRHEL